MKFPPFQRYIKSLIAAVLLAIIAYLLFPVLGLADTSSQQLFALGLALGAFLGGVLAGIEFGATALPAESGEKKTIFVGNLAFKATHEELQQLFEPYGPVVSVRIMKDRATRRPRGFAFVEMDASHAPKAIKALDGKEFLGRTLRVNEGSERKERS